MSNLFTQFRFWHSALCNYVTSIQCHVTEKAGKTANMADVLISLDFEGKTVDLTASSMHKSTVARFFNVHENGLHLKVSRNGKIENMWLSSNGKFLLPPGITNDT